MECGIRSLQMGLTLAFIRPETKQIWSIPSTQPEHPLAPVFLLGDAGAGLDSAHQLQREHVVLVWGAPRALMCFVSSSKI